MVKKQGHKVMGENIVGTGRYRLDNYRLIIQLVNY